MTVNQTRPQPFQVPRPTDSLLSDPAGQAGPPAAYEAPESASTTAARRAVRSQDSQPVGKVPYPFKFVLSY